MALLKFKRSAVPSKAPALGDLELGELAINTYDGKVYMKKDNGSASIVEVGGASTGGTVTSVAASGGTTGLTFTGSPITSSGTLTLGGTLSVANGGTGATSLTSGYLVKGNGTSAASASVIYDTGTNTGFGTSSPGYRVDIASADTTAGLGYGLRVRANATAAAGAIQFTDSAASAQWGFIAATSAALTIDCSSAGPIVFRTNGAERARIDSSGNVGIGTSSPGSFKLNVQGNVYNTTLAIGTDENLIYQSASNSLGFRVGTSTNQAYMNLRAVSGIPLIDGAGGVLALGTSGSERARIDSSGNFGIGTSNVLSRLDVSDQSRVRWYLNNSLLVNVEYANAAANAYVTHRMQAYDHQFYTSGSEKMRIGNNGGVAIGGTGTDASLHIQSAVGGYNRLTQLAPSGTSKDAFNIMAAKNSGGSDLWWSWGVDTSNRWRINQGVGFANNGIIMDDVGQITSADVAAAFGYKGVPINQQTTTYSLAMADMGKCVFATAGAFTITIPANATVAFPVGTAITIFCGDAAKTLAPASGVTLIQAGTNNTGNRTLGINAQVTLIKLQTNTWSVSGAGLT